MQFLSEHLRGVGRHGSEEAMRNLGAEQVIDLTLDSSAHNAPQLSELD